MKQLIRRIVKKGIAWYVDPLYREKDRMGEDIQRIYSILDGLITEDLGIARNVHGWGPFLHSLVPSAGTRVWVYRQGEAGRLAVRYLKECTEANPLGLIDDVVATTKDSDQGVPVLSLSEAIEKINEGDWLLFCGDGQENSYSYSYRQLHAKLLVRRVPVRLLHFWDLDMRPMFRRLTPVGYDGRLISRLCTCKDFYDPLFSKICKKLIGSVAVDRKIWEWTYIVRVLEDFGCLGPGAKGLGFAVGTEPLPSYFASLGVKVLATDINLEANQAKSWIETNAHIGKNINALFKENLCSRSKFEENVNFRYVDMNMIPDDLQGYDFCWSSCAIEHVGSLAQSKQFLKKMLRCLKPGGVAVHTTEFNLSSDVDTVEVGDNVLFRKKDIEEIKQYFLSLGCEMETSYLRSDAEEDNQIAIDPIQSPGGPPIINLVIGGFATTSFAIVVRKPS